MIDIATRVNIWLCILSFFLAAISIITVILTLQQNSRMIEASTRPSIAVYGQEIIVDENLPMFYLVIRNYGQSTAYMTKFHYNYDFKGCYRIDSNKDYLQEMNHAVIAPGQSRICALDYKKIAQEVEFDIGYKSETGKSYEGHFNIDITAGTAMPVAKLGSEAHSVQNISYTLQEILQKSL